MSDESGEEKPESWERSVVEKGGSVAVTIPSELADELDLKVGESATMVYEPGRDYYLIGKTEDLEPTTKVSLDGERVAVEMQRMPFSEEEIKEILEEKAEELEDG